MASVAREQVFENKDKTKGLATPLERVSEYSRPAEKVSYLMKRIFLSKKEIAGLFDVSPDSPLIYKYYILRYWKKLVGIVRFFFLSKKRIKSSGSVEILSRKKKIKRWLYEPVRDPKPKSLVPDIQ